MIRKQGELLQTEKERLQGGNGSIILDHMLELDKDEFYGKGRLFSIMTVKPGCSIGYHVHKGDMEVFYVLSGEAKYNDNGTETIIKKGDTAILFEGEGHSVENNTGEDLVMIALILYT